jgi:hypothetical protein
VAEKETGAATEARARFPYSPQFYRFSRRALLVALFSSRLSRRAFLVAPLSVRPSRRAVFIA